MGDEEEDGEPKYKLFVPGSAEPRDSSNQYTGEGKAVFVTGDTYDGIFVEGLRRGKGTYTFAKNGDVYQGHYEENRKHGFGKMTYTSKTGLEDPDAEPDPDAPPRGGSFIGYYAAGKRGCSAEDPTGEKEGTFKYVNGDVYVGQWCEGKKHGQGSYSYAKDGTKLVGEWVSGKITSGKWIFPNGTFYSGTFRYNKPFGKGVWVTAGGNQLTGEYLQKDQVAEDEGGGGEEEEGVEKPDPKVWCTFKHGQTTAVRGFSVFGPKFGA